MIRKCLLVFLTICIFSSFSYSQEVIIHKMDGALISANDSEIPTNYVLYLTGELDLVIDYNSKTIMFADTNSLLKTGNPHVMIVLDDLVVYNNNVTVLSIGSNRTYFTLKYNNPDYFDEFVEKVANYPEIIVTVNKQRTFQINLESYKALTNRFALYTYFEKNPDKLNQVAEAFDRVMEKFNSEKQ